MIFSVSNGNSRSSENGVDAVSNLTFSISRCEGQHRPTKKINNSTHRNLKSGFCAVRLTFYRTLSTRPLVTLAQFEEAQDCLLHILLHCAFDGHIVTDTGDNMPKVRRVIHENIVGKLTAALACCCSGRQPLQTVVSCELTVETNANRGPRRQFAGPTDDGAEAIDGSLVSILWFEWCQKYFQNELGSFTHLYSSEVVRCAIYL